MNRGFFCVAGLGAVLSALPLSAVTPDEDKEAGGNPFLSIVERNVFGIKPPPPPQEAPPPEAPPGPPPAKVMLTGILSVFGPPRALIEVAETEPGKQPTTKKPILREGEREGAIEVISIDIAKNVVRIKNGNIETNLTFEAPKQSATPAMAAAPPPLNVPAHNVLPSAATGVPTASVTHTGDGSGRRSIVLAGAQPAASTPTMPTTAGALPTIGNNSGMLAMGRGANSPSTVGTGLQIPSREVRANQPPPPQQQQAPVDPVTQYLTLRGEKELSDRTGRPYPPPPPVPGMPELDAAPADGFGGPPPPPPPPGFP